MALQRGDVYWVDFDPSIGGEIRKNRPAIIVSNDAANARLNRVLVVPLTSQTSQIYPGEALVDIRGQMSKAMADQVQTASKMRFGTRIGALSTSDLIEVERILRLQLDLSR